MYDYEEEFTTEEQDIVNEAVEKFREVLIKRRKEEWENFQDDREIFKKNKADFCAQRAAFEKEKKAFEASRDTLYAQFKKDWFDELGCQFKVGDRVWTIASKYDRTKCPICKGKKTFEVQTPYGDEITCKCSECNGTGEVSKVSYFPQPGTISEIRVTIKRSQGGCRIDYERAFEDLDTCNIYITPDKYGLEGRLCPPDKIYVSLDDCLAAIKQQEKE